MADNLTPGESKKSPWERIAASLALIGVKIGDGKNIKDPDHLADLVDVACLNSPQGEPDDENLEPQDDDQEEQQGGDLDQPPEGTTQPGQPLQMSLRERLDKRDAKLIDKERSSLVSRAKRVAASGALTPEDGDTLVQELTTVRLSLTAAGDLERNDSIVRLEALERVKPGTNWSRRSGKKVRLSHTRAVEPSAYSKTPGDRKDDDKVVDEFEQAVGRK